MDEFLGMGVKFRMLWRIFISLRLAEECSLCHCREWQGCPVTGYIDFDGGLLQTRFQRIAGISDVRAPEDSPHPRCA